MPSDLLLAYFAQPDGFIQRRDLQGAAFDEILNGSDAGSPVDGAERLVVAADDGNDGVDAFGLGEKELHQGGLDVRHVAAGDEREVGPRGGEAGVNPDERGADGVAVVRRPNAVGQPVEAAADDDRLGEQRAEASAKPIDDAFPVDRELMLREAQPLRLAAGEDDQRRRFAAHSPTLHPCA